MRKKALLGAALAITLFGVAACGDEGSGADQEASSEDQSTEQQLPEQEGQDPQQPELPEPDLEGIPDVVAEVNGKKIDKEEFEAAYESQFQQMMMQAQMTGEEINQDELKASTAENLVGNELLTQEAENRKITASKEQVDDTLQEMAEANGMESGEEFIAALAEQGMAEDEVMDQLETQVEIEQLIAEEAGDTEPTEAELQELYEQSAAQQEQAAGEGGEAGEMPAFEEVEDQLKEQVKAQKEGEAMQALVDSLRDKGDVTVHL